MTTLYSYCIPVDDGAAPNPFWGVCTLIICKPVIRRMAQTGDWVVGLGSKSSPIGDVSAQVVYAMKVTQKMTMEEYDAYTQPDLSKKIPDWHHRDFRRRVGDSIYDFSSHPPRLRESVHLAGNRKTDLGGKCALLSNHFYYFGDKPVPLPKHLKAIIKQGQGHRSKSNEPYVDRFIQWIEGLGYTPNSLLGKPQQNLFADEKMAARCASARCQAAKEDEQIMMRLRRARCK